MHDSTGTEYQYTTFDTDGKATTISFDDPNDSSGEYPYYFNNKEVSKKEYDNLTKEYIALSKKPASIQWHDYEQSSRQAEVGTTTDTAETELNALNEVKSLLRKLRTAALMYLFR